MNPLLMEPDYERPYLTDWRLSSLGLKHGPMAHQALGSYLTDWCLSSLGRYRCRMAGLALGSDLSGGPMVLTLWVISGFARGTNELE